MFRVENFFLTVLFAMIAFPAAAENQVINKKFDWKTYSTPNFDIYYYEDSKPLLKYAAYVLERARSEQSVYLAPDFNKRIPFFLFASSNDMQRNSITEVGDGTGGLTEPYKDRFMVWSDGSKEWLKNVIYHEFAHEQEFAVLVDGVWKSARILKTYIYPLWMMEGIAEYATGDNDLAIEDLYVRDAVADNKLISLLYLQQFGHLKPHQTTLAYKIGAQAIRFLAREYGRDKPAMMLQIYRNRYDINSVLSSLTGTDIFGFDSRFAEYESIKYNSQIKKEGLSDPSIHAAKLTFQKDDIPDFNTSPVISYSYRKMAWFSTRDGHPPALVIRNMDNGRENILDYRALGVENIPYSRFTMPLRHLSISNSGKYLAFSAQKNHVEYLCIYDLENGKLIKIPATGFLEARQFSFSTDDSRLVFVGMTKGRNEIYEIKFDLSAKELRPETSKRLTDDDHDEMSPVYLSDTEIIYSRENGYFDDLKRSIHLISSSGENRELLSVDGNIYDLFYDVSSRTVYFISDAGNIFDLYSWSPADGKVFRLTRSIGGAFTPFVSGNKIYFSYFRNGSMNLYGGRKENFLYAQEKALSFSPPEKPQKEEQIDGVYKDYRFKASTDLFFPAFMFSSPGGFFWMNYWQASDFLGYNDISLYLNYNSAHPYMNSQFQYTYDRFRTRLFYQNTLLKYNGEEDKNGFEYDRRYSRNIFGGIYPFDRYNRAEFYAIIRDNEKRYNIGGLDSKSRNRAFQLSYISDHLNGLYLTAIRGNRLELTWQKAVEKLGGNEKYDIYAIENLKYLPLSRRSVFVNRLFGALSTGRDRKEFDFGGINGLRGFTRYGSTNENTRLLMYNGELRLLLTDMNYYMWYIFPDFYFKAIYLKLFSDNAYGWDINSQLSGFNISDIKNSIGVGVNFHTFVLQAFQMVLSFDYAMRTDDGGKIFYFYLGPLF